MPQADREVVRGSQARLRLTGSGYAGFRRMRWLWELRDAGVVSRLKPTEFKVLMMMLSRANRSGHSWPSVARLAAEVGAKPRAVQLARQSLVDAGLITDAGVGPQGQRRYKFASFAAAVVAGDVEPGGAQACAGGAHRRAHGGARVCAGGRTGVRPKENKKQNIESGGIARPSPTEGTLFEPPGRDAAAAALLRRIGIPAREASGLVTSHRPTAAQVRAVIANAFALVRAHRRGEATSGLGSLPAFVRAAIQRGDYRMDERVIRLKHQGARRATAAATRRADAVQAVTRQVEASTTQQRQARAAAAWDAMGAAERDQVWRSALEALRTSAPLLADRWESLPADHPRRRQAAIEHLVQREDQP